MKYSSQSNGRVTKPPLYDGDGEMVEPGRSYTRDSSRYYGRYTGNDAYRPPVYAEPSDPEAPPRVYDDFQPRYDRRPPEPPPKKKKERSRFWPLWLVTMLLCLTLLVLLVLMMLPQLMGVQTFLPSIAFVNGRIVLLDEQAYSDYRSYRQYMATNTIYPGIYVDGIDIGGMTMEQARNALASVPPASGYDFSITVEAGGSRWLISSDAIPLTRNTDQVLAQAYAIGRINTPEIRGSGTTPFRQRTLAAMELRSSPVSLYTEQTYDHDAVRNIAESIASTCSREPVNASVASFDFNTGIFGFNSDQEGTLLEADEVYDAVIAAIDSGDSRAVLTFRPKIILAEVTKTQLMSSFMKISSYTTSTTDDKNRNINVELSAMAINGTTVLPGETFSFNQATGERTAEKGYKPAAAISGGQSKDEIGGGVCQTSSTLFNAVARADLEIVTRSPHAWPSHYVEKGMDATVNWPGLDFQFRNNTEWPIFIVASYHNRKVTVDIYGMTLGNGVTIDLVSKTTRTIDPPEGVNYVQNPSLPSGTQKTTVKARTGYEVETWKVYSQNGVITDQTLLCKSTYKAYQQTVEYN